MSIENTAAAALLVDVVRDLVTQAWRKATSTDGPAEAIEKVVERTVEGAIGGLFRELQRQIDALGLAVATSELEAGARDVLAAFVPRGMIPPLGLDVEIVGPDEKLDTSDVVVDVDEGK